MGYADKVRGGKGRNVREITDTVPVFLDDMTPDVIKKEIGTGKQRVWSDQQHKIFHWFKTSKIGKKVYKNLIVVARAGTGKTTTIVEAIQYLDEGLQVLLAAFNKRIATELESRVNHPNAVVKTLHAVGFSIIREYVRRVRIAKGDDRARNLAITACGKDTPDTILKLVAKLHTKAREITPFALDEKDGGIEVVWTLAEQFECDPEFFWHAQGFDMKYVVTKALKCLQIVKDGDVDEIDFADMIFVPLVKGWAMPMFDVGVVDEAQDMTVAQLELFRRVIKPDGRICVIGDDKQAIYAFRGADSTSLSRLQKELQAGELGLTTTYRCGKVIVNEVRSRFVDDFEAGPSNPEGEIRSIVREDLVDRVEYGDFILSRLNAPLAAYAMQLIRSRRRARIAGKDIGQMIKTNIRKLSKGSTSVEGFLSNLHAHAVKMRKRFVHYKNAQQKLEELEDLVETMENIAMGCNSVREMEVTVDNLFTDDGLGDAGMVTLSSVHKAKGLEADNVYVLGWTLRTGKSQEEDNIHYVAITRARDVLTMVQ